MSTADHDITIWGAGTTRTLRVIWTAEELGLRYKLHPIGPRTGETRTAEYTRLNGKQKIPFMHDGVIGLSESVAICRYLIQKYGSQEKLYLPDSLEARAKEDEWVCYIYGELDETSLYVMRRHGDLKAIYGDAPAAVKSASQYASKHLAVIDEHMCSSDYVAGNHFGLADILLISCLDWARAYGIELPNSLTEYQAQMAERPAYQKAININYRKQT
jgi:glutathione S-transferase